MHISLDEHKLSFNKDHDTTFIIPTSQSSSRYRVPNSFRSFKRYIGNTENHHPVEN